MGYIRSDEDYYCSLGYTPSQAAKLVEADKRKHQIDYGYCNPIKAKLAAEDEASVSLATDRAVDGEE